MDERISVWTRKPMVRDVGVAALLLSGTVAWTNGTPRWWAATALCLAAVVARRPWPVPALVAAVSGTVIHMASCAGPAFVDLAAPLVLVTIAGEYRRRVSVAFLASTLLVAGGWSLLVAFDGRVDGWALNEVKGVIAVAPLDVPGAQGHVVTRRIGPTDWGSLPLFGSLVAGWAVGSGAQSRRVYLDQLTARARDLERERDQQTALAAAAERSRITRELHDVVAHGLAVIVMQAQGGAAALERRPADTRAALDTIVETGRASLADIRQVLATVGASESAPHPVPGLDRLPRLVEQVREAGTPVRLHVEGRPRVLPATVDLSAYRIVQEALTNTMKHAGPKARARVTVRYEDERLTLEVSDDGVGPSPRDTAGNGMRGMRERVAQLRGEVWAAPGPGGGFVVRARLPIRVEPAG
ncbi:sensor histidine kinase [Thermomonospora umbrina]|uniref:histidine kinase n=1 Tax=Thermomonospora umbrina TaxID=111806 RepID=A0A3D9SP24_9ACTN|nr:sensor histidine kinase [Thermomonospora umbrina]REE97377.1 signal transduction histidine kinase [Thermomonospora umbrina]